MKVAIDSASPAPRAWMEQDFKAEHNPARPLPAGRQPASFFASLFEFFPCSPSRIVLQLWGNEFNFTTEHKWVRISHQWPPA